MFAAASRSNMKSLPLEKRRSYRSCLPVICFEGHPDCVFLGGRIVRSSWADCGFDSRPSSFEAKNMRLVSFAKGFAKLYLRIASIMNPGYPTRASSSVQSSFPLQDSNTVYIELYVDPPSFREGFTLQYNASRGDGLCGYKIHGFVQRDARVHVYNCTVFSELACNPGKEYSFNPQRYSLKGQPDEEALLDRILTDEFHLGSVGRVYAGSMRISHRQDLSPRAKRRVTFRYASLENILSTKGSYVED